MNNNMYSKYQMEHPGEMENPNDINNPPQTVQNTLLPMIGFIMFISICSTLYGICTNDTSNRENRENTENINTNLITTINKDLSTYEKNKGDEYCSICLEEFIQKENIITLECSHYYHQKCIIDWFKKETTCPLCRKIFI